MLAQTDLAAAWIAVLASVLGALAGGVGTYLVQRRSWSREDQFRWHESKRLAYVRILQAFNEAYEATGDVIQDLRQAPSKVDPKHLDLELQKREAEIAARMPLYLLGGPALIQTTDAFTDVLSLQGTLIGDLTDPAKRSDALIGAEGRMSEIRRKFAKAVSAFTREAQAELGIRTPKVPRSRWRHRRVERS